MKTFLFILTFYSLLLSNSDENTCKKCHPVISQEFETSMHKRSSIYEDKIHKAVWDLHPSKAKDDYKCAKCHTPNIAKKEEQHKGITCISCHTIKNVEEHSAANKNIYTIEEKTFYSAEKGREGEKVIYTNK